MRYTKPATDIYNLRGAFTIYLGGSRYMAERCLIESLSGGSPPIIDISKTTDFDYYSTYSIELEKELIKCEWFNKYPNSGHDYFDTETIQIFEKEDYQIVLRKDADYYRDVFESIPTWYYHEYLWKSSPKKPSRDLIQQNINFLFTLKRKWSK